MELLGVFILYPWLAAAVAVVFGVLYHRSGRLVAAFTCVLWLLYTGYEYGMKQRWLCTGECNIRVDLLLIYPFLFLLSIAAVFSARSAIAERRPRSHRRR